MKISSVMGRMTLRERKMLHESVKRRISEGGDAAPAVPPAEPSESSPVGSTLSKGGDVIFKKTWDGWKTTLRIREDEILDLVNDNAQDAYKQKMRASRGQGEELYIVKSQLKDPGAANTADSLLLKRDGDSFADPVAVKNIAEISKTLGLSYDETKGSYAIAADSVETHYIGNAAIKIGSNAVTLSVSSSDPNAFDDLFGRSNTDKLARAVARVFARKNPKSLKIPLSYALDHSIMKFMSDSVLSDLGIGKIEFVKSQDSYAATVKLTDKQISRLREALPNQTPAA